MSRRPARSSLEKNVDSSGQATCINGLMTAGSVTKAWETMMTVVPLPQRPTRGGAMFRGMTIRELAARTGATLRALRHYEDIGLLTAGRDARGARCYDADQRRAADLITGLRRLGMPIRDIYAAV